MTIKVVGGRPTMEELAAVLVVLHARAASGAPGRATPEARDALGVWACKVRAARDPGMPRPGPGAWRATYRPR